VDLAPRAQFEPPQLLSLLRTTAGRRRKMKVDGWRVSLRVAGPQHASGAKHGFCFTKRPEVLTNDFFANCGHGEAKWQPARRYLKKVVRGPPRDRSKTECAQVDWNSRDLIFGSHSQLECLRGEGVRCSATMGSKEKFVKDFLAPPA